MSRDICIYQEFLTDAHRPQIEDAARETGFTPHFFTPNQLEEARPASSTARCSTPTPRSCCAPPPPP